MYLVNSDFKQELNDIYRTFYLSQNYRHAVKKSYTQNWELFWPSSFVYAFFAFNTLYSCNWSNCLDQDKKNIDGLVLTSEYDLPESNKINNLIKFCYKLNNDETPTYFYGLLTKNLDHLRIKNPLSNLEQMHHSARTVDNREGFLKKFQQIYHKEDISLKNHRKAVGFILNFVYQVRNNIFHGSKTVSMMMDARQQERLKIYTAILLSTCELLFISLEKHSNWKKPIIIKN